MHEAEALSELMQFCKSKEILLIQDEIFVGFDVQENYLLSIICRKFLISCVFKRAYRRNTSFGDNNLYRRNI